MSANQESKVEKRTSVGTPSARRKRGAGTDKKASRPQAERQLKSTASEEAEAQISLEDLFPPTLKKPWQTEANTRQVQNIASARQAYIHQGLVLYIGAGVSCSVGLPTWLEMIRLLTVTMMARRVDWTLAPLRSLSEEQRALAKLRIQEEVSQGAGADMSILIMARSIKDSFGSSLPYELAQVLYGPLFKSSPTKRLIADFVALVSGQKKRPIERLDQYPAITNSKLFSAIVQLARAQRDVRGVQAIVNFNYDDLIEEWMRENGIRCDTLLSGKEKSSDASLPCYHVHGVLPFRKIQELNPTENSDSRNIIGNFVFSEDEYHTEYSDPYRWSNMTMINQLGRYSGLFVGLSLQDPNQRRLIDVTHRQYPDIVNYAILTRKTPKNDIGDSKQSILLDLFEKVETESFENLGVQVIWTDSFDEVPARILDICNLDSPKGKA
jgi:hypothetical protein